MEDEDRILGPWGDLVSAADFGFHPEKLEFNRNMPYHDMRRLYRAKLKGYGVADTKTNARIKVYKSKLTLQVSNDHIFPTADWEKENGKPKREYDVPPKGQAVDPARAGGGIPPAVQSQSS